MAAGPISRILSALQRDGHSSGPRITAGLKRPTRRFQRTEPARAPVFWSSLPIWSCSVWGLPCPPHYCAGGALLPHLFTLTRTLRSGRYVFCGTFRPTGLNRPSRTLSGTLLCGVRTFLPSCDERPSGPAANHFIIVQADGADRECRRCCAPDGAFSHPTSLGARKYVYVSRAKPTNNGINPAR